MPLTRWTDRSLPQTLQIGMILLYINAGIGLLFGQILAFPFGTAVVLGSAAAGLGIANNYRLGWIGGIVVAGAEVALTLLVVAGSGFDAGSVLSILLNLLFPVALLALLLHPQSRDYQQLWFH